MAGYLNPIKLYKGIRQGCPLFVLLALISRISCNFNNRKIKGIDIPTKRQLKIGQYAADTTLFVRDEKSIEECLNTVKHFGQFAGLTLNVNKTEGHKANSLNAVAFDL